MDSYRPYRRRETDHQRRFHPQDPRRHMQYDDIDDNDRYRARSRSPPRPPRGPRTLNYDEDGDGGLTNDQVIMPYANYNPSDHLRAEKDGTFDPPGPWSRGHNPHNPDWAAPYHGKGDGSDDEDPSRLLLIRNLTARTNGALLAKDLEMLYEGYDEIPGGAIPKSLWRVMIVRARYDNQSMGQAFAEYYKVSDAKAAKKKFDSMGSQFVVDGNQLTLTWPHNGVFPPATLGGETNPKFTIRWRTGQTHKYHDTRAYADALIINDESPHEEDRLQSAANPAIKTSSTDEQTSEASKPKKRKVNPSKPVPNAMVRQLDYNQAKLREEAAQNRATRAYPLPGASNTAIRTRAIDITEQTFVHEGEFIACYLCNSRFKERDGVLRHVLESANHGSKLKNSNDVHKAHERMKQKNISPDATLKLTQDMIGKTSEPELDDKKETYRDRAAERRDNEPVKKVSMSLKGPKRPGSSSSGSDNEAKKPSFGKGASMLQKAGWTEGQSLGDGTGITRPIDQSVYAAGVGLGHEGSKKGDAVEEAQRLTKKAPGEFLEKTKDVFRERFEQMK